MFQDDSQRFKDCSPPSALHTSAQRRLVKGTPATNEKQKCSTTEDLAARLQIVQIRVWISHPACLFPLAAAEAADEADGSLPSKQLLLLWESVRARTLTDVLWCKEHRRYFAAQRETERHKHSRGNLSSSSEATPAYGKAATSETLLPRAPVWFLFAFQSNLWKYDCIKARKRETPAALVQVTKCQQVSHKAALPLPA